MDVLPDSILLEIFFHASKAELLDMATVCWRWRDVCFDRTLWKDISTDELYLDDASEDTIKRFIDYGEKVFRLSLNNCIAVTDRLLVNFSHNADRLRVLNLEGCLKVTDEGVKLMGEHCRQLKEINLLQTMVGEEGVMSLIQESTGIVEFSAPSQAVSLKVIEQLVNLHLRSVVVEKCPTNQHHSILTSLMVQQLCRCPKLAFLVLDYHQAFVNDMTLALLGHYCPRIECCEIANSDVTSPVTDNGIVNLCRGLPNLLQLKLERTKVTDMSMFAVATFCSDIHQLDLGNCDSISDVGIASLLQSCTGLEKLAIGAKDNHLLTRSSIYRIAQSKCAMNLIRLSLEWWQFTDKDLDVLASATPNLMYLSLKGCQWVSAPGVQIAFTHWRQMVELDLSHTNCFRSDIDLVILFCTVHALQRLFLYGCEGVSAKGVKMVEKQQSNCIIESDVY